MSKLMLYNAASKTKTGYVWQCYVLYMQNITIFFIYLLSLELLISYLSSLPSSIRLFGLKSNV